MSYIPVKHQEKIIAFQPFQLQITVNNVSVQRQCIFFNLHTTEKLPSVSTEYICFYIDDKYTQVPKCVKSRIMAEVIECVLSIDKFEQQCVVIKGMLQPNRLEHHMKTIGINQSLINNDLF